MTNTEFQAQCGERLVDVGLVLENEKIKDALRKRDDALVLKLLDEEF